MSNEELAVIRNIVLLHESKAKEGGSTDQSKVVVAGTSGNEPRRLVKERLGAQPVPNKMGFAELHHHVEDQPCRFGWDR